MALTNVESILRAIIEEARTRAWERSFCEDKSLRLKADALSDFADVIEYVLDKNKASTDSEDRK
jgi:hypothetical protein